MLQFSYVFLCFSVFLAMSLDIFLDELREELVDDDTLIETSGAYPPGTASFIRALGRCFLGRRLVV